MVVILIVWAALTPFAAIMAFLITYEEYRRHFPLGHRALREALVAASVTMAVFLALGVVAALVLGRSM